MKTLNTRIVLRNDSTVNWLANESAVLLKGEVGLEFLSNGSVKMKVGDGSSTWSNLPYFGQELVGDKKSIDIIDDVIQLVGFGDAEVNATPVKNSDGSISWKLPDTTLIDQLNSDVSNLKIGYNTLAEAIGSVSDGEIPATGLYALIDEKANKSDVYTKDEIAALVSRAYNYKGSVSTYSDLPKEGQNVGDIWNIENADPSNKINAGDNVAWNGTSWDVLSGTVDLSGYTPKDEFEAVKSTVDNLPSVYLTKNDANALFNKVRYEFVHKPAEARIDYREKEIRVMCPSNTKWTLQNVGANGLSNHYYLGLRIYAPSKDVVSFKEDTNSIINDHTIHTFDGKFSGVDEYGRKYSIIWLAAAYYEEGTNTWHYYGDKSVEEKYVGWDYTVEWYDANGNIVESSTIRINLTNENTHNNIKPYYMAGYVTKNSLEALLDNKVDKQEGYGLISDNDLLKLTDIETGAQVNLIESIKVAGTELPIVDKIVDIPFATANMAGVIKSAEEVDGVPTPNAVYVDPNTGVAQVKTININSIVQDNDDELIINGGNA